MGTLEQATPTSPPPPDSGDPTLAMLAAAAEDLRCSLDQEGEFATELVEVVGTQLVGDQTGDIARIAKQVADYATVDMPSPEKAQSGLEETLRTLIRERDCYAMLRWTLRRQGRVVQIPSYAIFDPSTRKLRYDSLAAGVAVSAAPPVVRHAGAKSAAGEPRTAASVRASAESELVPEQKDRFTVAIGIRDSFGLTNTLHYDVTTTLKTVEQYASKAYPCDVEFTVAPTMWSEFDWWHTAPMVVLGRPGRMPSNPFWAFSYNWGEPYRTNLWLAGRRGFHGYPGSPSADATLLKDNIVGGEVKYEDGCPDTSIVSLSFSFFGVGVGFQIPAPEESDYVDVLGDLDYALELNLTPAASAYYASGAFLAGASLESHSSIKNNEGSGGPELGFFRIHAPLHFGWTNSPGFYQRYFSFPGSCTVDLTLPYVRAGGIPSPDLSAATASPATVEYGRPSVISATVTNPSEVLSLIPSAQHSHVELQIDPASLGDSLSCDQSIAFVEKIDPAKPATFEFTVTNISTVDREITPRFRLVYALGPPVPLDYAKRTNDYDGPTLTLKAPSEASISGHVRDTNSGAPVALASVGIDYAGTTEPNPSPRSTLSNADGWFGFDDVTLGEWILSCSTDRFAPLEYAISVAEGDVAVIDLYLTPIPPGPADPDAYIGNVRSHELHRRDCSWVPWIAPDNRVLFVAAPIALNNGYNGCRYCMAEFDTG